MKIAVVGATGLVGQMMLKVLEERQFQNAELIPVASEKSIGKTIHFNGQPIPVISPYQAIDKKPDIALFSAGSQTSLILAPAFVESGAIVIDNSSAWRKDPAVPLIVPEVNAHILKKTDRIIANPNCSTIQLVVVLKSLHDAFILKRVVISTYQSVTGSGIKGVNQLNAERQQAKTVMAYPHPIDLNVIPQGGEFEDNAYTLEENKLIFETRKILGIPDLPVTCTVVRVPVFGGHSESVNVEFVKDSSPEAVREEIRKTPGTLIADEPEKALYPMPLFAQNRDEVFVGRIRQDFSVPSGINLWIVSDNLRKGAATNAVQIARYLVDNALL